MTSGRSMPLLGLSISIPQLRGLDHSVLGLPGGECGGVGRESKGVSEVPTWLQPEAQPSADSYTELPGEVYLVF